MRTYETTFIINPQTDDATIDKHVKDIADIITDIKGEIIHQENMGTRRLAYEINGLTQGFYANLIYQAPVEVLPILDKHFKQNEVYLRNLTIRIEGDPQEILKPVDVLGKQSDRGGDRDDRRGSRYHSDRPRHHRDSKPENKPADEKKAETPAEKKTAPAPVEEVKEAPKAAPVKPADTAPVETDDKPKEEL